MKILNQKKIIQKYTNQDEKAFKKIFSKSPKDKTSQNYTEKDIKAFNNIVLKKTNTNNTSSSSIKNIPGKSIQRTKI